MKAKLRPVLMMCLILLGALAAQGRAAGAPAASSVSYTPESKRYTLRKPLDWTVQEDARDSVSRLVVQAPDRAAQVDFFWTRNPEGKSNALGLLGAYTATLRQAHPDVTLSEVFVSPDGCRAVATVQYRGAPGAVRGRYFFESDAQRLAAQGYCAPEARLAAERSRLLAIMASLTILPAGAGADGSSAARPQPIQFVQLPLVQRRAPDGSLTINVPPEWNFLAQGGKVITGAPNGGMGFIFTTIQGLPMARNASIAQGVVAAPYSPPPAALAQILKAFGHRNVKILNAQPDPATNNSFLRLVGRRCDAQDLLVSWHSSGGAACVGAFKAICALPSLTGQWFCMLAGLWGPEKDFFRYYPALEQIAGSFAVNDQYARQYIQAGLENLKRLQQKTMAAMQDLSNAKDQQQKDWQARQQRKELMDSKWDDYRRGRSYWVSDLEGGKVYQTDSWGTQDTSSGETFSGQKHNYVNFDGQNPRHPSETMREVSGHELQQLLHGQR